MPLGAHRLSPSLQLGQVHAIRRRFSPGCSSPASACSICSWICVGLSPLMVTLLPDTFCTVSCCCPGGGIKRRGGQVLTLCVHVGPVETLQRWLRGGETPPFAGGDTLGLDPPAPHAAPPRPPRRHVLVPTRGR